ncbi:MAG: hypothetical protein IJ242_04045 [Clostridia bacterium]|nr:hypothetical protein [Clostridia bacterium]
MNNLTELIKKEIKKQYGSLKRFAAETGISFGTINTAIHKDIGGSSFDFVMKICKDLGIKQIFDDDINQVSSRYYNMVKKLEMIDEQGIATIETIIDVEVERCKNRENKGTVKRYNGVGYVGTTEDRIKELIREVLEEQQADVQTFRH